MTGVWEIVKIIECREAGLNKTATAKRLSIHRETVAKYWETTDPNNIRTGCKKPSKLDPYKEYIINRLVKWPELSAQRIFEEIQEKGYPGFERNVRRYVATVRPKRVREFKPYETMPGEQAQIDCPKRGLSPPGLCRIMQDELRKSQSPLRLAFFVFNGVPW